MGPSLLADTSGALAALLVHSARIRVPLQRGCAGLQLLNRGVFSVINGCVSTGKEANVYHAKGGDGVQDIAIKIFKTSILVFKDRERYVSGDHRFQNRSAKGNPRQMVKTWAEKEMRNLLRLQAAGIRCPKPLLLRMHVLVMDFIGEVRIPRR